MACAMSGNVNYTSILYAQTIHPLEHAYNKNLELSPNFTHYKVRFFQCKGSYALKTTDYLPSYSELQTRIPSAMKCALVADMLDAYL